MVDFEEIHAALWSSNLGLPQTFKYGRLAAHPDFVAAWRGPKQKIAVVGSLTIDFVANGVACAVLREGVLPELYAGLHGAYVQEILDPQSSLHEFKPDAVVIVPDWRDEVADLPIGANLDEIAHAMHSRVLLCQQLWSTLENVGCTIYQHVLDAPVASVRGVAERLSPASAAAQAAQLTSQLFEAGRGRVNWIETDRLAALAGRRRWSPDGLYFSAKHPFDPRYLPAYVRCFGGAWRAANGRAKKVLVVDLDNTMWGGIIGDDGVDGIKLGPGTATGEAYAAWGAYVKALGARGVTLAVCSKNEPDVAKTGFTHPHFSLTLEEFAAFHCSWEDKPSAIRRIAESLNIGIDSLVFADDNPAECDLVRRELPMVGVVDLGSDPSLFIEKLEQEHWFDVQDYTVADLHRTKSYSARRQAEAARAQATDLDGFLKSLEMHGRMWEATEADLARIAQMEQKTNQFNVTGRRYDESAIRAFHERNDAMLLAFSLRDKFGDHGLVSSVVAIADGDALRIDSWLMSCRVFSRTAEQFIMQRLFAIARERGFARVLAEYIPTERNHVVAQLYSNLGFSAEGSGRGLWLLELDSSPKLFTHIAQDASEESLV